MPVTMCRIIRQRLGPAMQIAGLTVELPDECTLCSTNAPIRLGRPPGCAHYTGSGPFRDAYTVMNNWGANHGAISYGHIGPDLMALCALLRIPVYMHNVGEERIFRPSAWAEFGANEPMGADFRACANFGPLYG